MLEVAVAFGAEDSSAMATDSDRLMTRVDVQHICRPQLDVFDV